ncbi:hypothetical protein ACN27F_02050 [Solwaraspora sp. WMMB335]|uniref:hypothetical protein n=1 Tax=Solwaraspora sp. WMMB335 TaxID=3404118 RepID=UPI003B936687
MGTPAPRSTRYGGAVATGVEPDSVLLPGHDVPLGRYTTVRRPRRMVGAWCFVGDFGPDDVAGRPGMQIPPQHPPVIHGLQLWVALPERALTDGVELSPGALLYLGRGRSGVAVHTAGRARPDRGLTRPGRSYVGRSYLGGGAPDPAQLLKVLIN